MALNINIHTPNGLVPISPELTYKQIVDVLGYTPLDASNYVTYDSISEADDSAFYVVDSQQHILAQIDEEGLKAAIMTVNGKDVESGLIYDIKELADDAFYIVDSQSNVIAKIGENGLETTNIIAQSIITNNIESSDSELYIVDTNNRPILSVDANGLETTNITATDAVLSQHSVVDHIEDYEIHITEEERQTWNSKSKFDSISEDDNTTLYINDKNNKTIAKFDADGLTVTNVSTNDVTVGGDKSVLSHINNTSIHITDSERTTWNTVTSKASKTALSEHINDTDKHLGDEISLADNSALYINDKDNNTIVKVNSEGLIAAEVILQSDKEQHSLLEHITNTDIHLQEGERELWNAKIDSSTLTQKLDEKTDKTDFNAHIQDDDLHIGGEISLDDNTTLYINDAGGNVIAKFDASGLNVGDLFLNNQHVATEEYVNGKVTGLFEFKDSISSNAEVPAVHEVGDAYRINKDGEYAGKTCEEGDMLVCIVNGSTDNNEDWIVLQQNWTAVDGSSTLKWGEAVTLATIGGVTIDAKLPNISSITSKIATGTNGSTNNATTDVTDPYINHVEGSVVNSSVQFKGANTASVKAKNGVITIDSGITSADTSKWNTVANKVDTSVYNAGQAAQNTSIADLFENKVDTSVFDKHTSNTNMHLVDGERTKWNAVVNKVDTSVYNKDKTELDASIADLFENKVDTSVYNAGQDAQNASIDKLFTDKVDTSVYNVGQDAQDTSIADLFRNKLDKSVYDKDKTALDNAISDISTKVGTKANKTDFEEHINDADLHLGDEISLEDDSTLYITDKDGKIIVRADEDGLTASNLFIDDKEVATKEYVNGKVTGLFEFKDSISSNAEVPAVHEVGDTYRINIPGEYAGKTCEKGDMLVCIADGSTANNEDWTVLQQNWTAVDGSSTLKWGETTTLATIGGVTIDATLPVNPNTTYQPGTGLKLDDTTFNHTNSITAGAVSGGSGQLDYKGTIKIPSIAYDSEGHITDVSTTSYTLPDNSNVTSKIVTGTNGSTSNTTTEVVSPYINHVEGSVVNSSVQFKGANTATVKAVNGVITIDSGVTSADTSKWNTIINKVDTSLYNADKIKLDASISKLFEDKLDTSAFDKHTSNTSVHLVDGERTKWNTVVNKVDTSVFDAHANNSSIHITDPERITWNTVVNKVDTSVYNVEQVAQNASITSKLDISVYNVGKAALDKTISDISTKVGTKANQTDFEEHITNTDLHLGDEINLEDDSTLYISDKDGKIIAKFTQSGFDAKLIRQDDNVVASNVIVDASIDTPYIDEDGTLHLITTINGLTIKGPLEPANIIYTRFPLNSKINDAYIVSRDALSGEYPENAKKGDLWICVKESEQICDDEKCFNTYPVFEFNGVNLCGPAGKDGTSVTVEDSSYLDVSSKIVNNNNTLSVNVKTQTLEDAISTGVDAGLATAYNVATIIHNNELVVTSALNAFKNKIGLANDLTIDWEGKYEAGTSIIEAIKNITDTSISYVTNRYSLKFGNKSYDGSSEQTITAEDLGLSQTDNLNIDFQTTEQDALVGDQNIIYFTTDTNRIIYQGKIFSKEGYVYNASLNSFSTNTASALGNDSHAEGYKTTASGKASHVEGNGVEAIGVASHAEGWHDIDSANSAIYIVKQDEVDNTKYFIVSDFRGVTSDSGKTLYLKHGMTFLYEDVYYYVTEVFYNETNPDNPTSFRLNQSISRTDTNEFSIELILGKSIGTASHTEGNNAVAYGNFAHAEGNSTRAAGENSHTEGVETSTIGSASHAEGQNSVAIGDFSHAEGNNTIAVGIYSHTEGIKNTAEGYASHAEGGRNRATNSFEHAQGYFNVSNTGSDLKNQTISSIGVGYYTGGNDSPYSEEFAVRKNALEVMRNGDMYVYGLGDYDGTNAVNPNSEEKTAKTLQEYLKENELPQKENELIYFDGNKFVSNQLVHSDGLVVDNDDDLEYCQSNAETSLSTVLSSWTAYGSSESDRNDWGYCDSIENDPENPGKCIVTLVGKDSISVPPFKLNGEPQDYIFNTTNTGANTGFFTPKKYSNYDVTVCVGSFNTDINRGHDYLGNLIAINSQDSSNLESDFYGVSLHTLLLYPDGSDGVYKSRPNYAENIKNSTSGVYDMPGSTIQITAFKQTNLNSEDSYQSHENNIPILSISEGLKIVPLKDYDAEIHGSSGNSKSYGIQSRVIRKGDIFIIYFSEAYRLYEDDDITMVDDSNYSVDKNRSAIIDLSNYTLKYTYYNGDEVETVTKEFEKGLGTSYINPAGENTEYTDNQIESIRTIFDEINEEAHRGFESKSTANGFFRYVSGFDEKILDIRTEKNCVYKFENGNWNITGENPFDLLKTGSRLALNKKTNKLFYNDGLTVYQIADISGQNRNNIAGDLRPSTQPSYSAGDNIDITDDVISVTGMPQVYEEGDNITLENTTNDEGKSVLKINGLSKNALTYNPERRSIALQYNEEDDSYNEAQADYSVVMGWNNKAIREETDGAGLTLQAANSFVGGMDNRVYHSNCIVFGEGLYTQFGNTFVLGKYNGTVSNQDSWGDTVLGIVGDGYKDSDGNVTGRNVLLLQGGGDPALHCRGAFKNNASWINDFGEYFEWLDGNPDNEDRIGYMVQLNGNKIELATSVEKCIGVISGTAGFIGGVCAFEWHNKFLRDKWGREIIGEDGNPVINPDYNPELEYIPREQRKEWDVVALVGQVITRQDGTLEVGSYADCSNGIATNATRGFKVLKIIDNEAALLLVK